MRLLSSLSLATGVVLASVASAQAASASAVVTTDEVRAELIAHAPEGVAPGKPMWLGLQIDHQPHWHTYWKNPGDSGLPTTLSWSLPAGVNAGEIAWPTPMRLPVGPLVNYGYEQRVVLPVPLSIGPGFQAGAVNVKLTANWLVCKDVCIPQQGEFALNLPLGGPQVVHRSAFEMSFAAAPKDAAGVTTGATLSDDAKTLRVTLEGLPAALQGKDLAFFAELAGVIDHAGKPAAQWQGNRWQADVPVSAQRFESPSALHAVLTDPTAAPGTPGTRVSLPIAGTWPGPAAPAAPVAATDAAPAAIPPTPATPPAGLSLGLALVFALVGGALLNLMPCVFPVLSLKALGLAQHHGDRRGTVASGIAYTAGVVLSFVALAGLLIALRAGGEQLGWGFQLQSPMFIAALALLFTLIALNLAGVFEFGTLLPSSLAGLQLRHPLADAFLTGVLAVAVASPCTAPFMGAALGTAFTLPPPQALLLFAVLGLGMALPYLLLTTWPALAKALPRPGAWMATFKTLMAFPMLATVVWLVWVLGQQSGIDGAVALLAVLVVLALAAWLWARPSVAARGVGVAALAASLVWAGPLWREAPTAATVAPAGAEERWQPWSRERVATLNAEGRTVFVDFTAAWCVTCQFNKRTVLSDATLLAEMEASKVVLMRADWTKRDAAISAELQRLGRNGVPVYAVYRHATQTPTLLPEILTAQAVRDAVALPSRPQP
jgi:thiol:disulfide interchange protein/DsbC/DsbD-like thiol-disulfide interchange protein